MKRIWKWIRDTSVLISMLVMMLSMWGLTLLCGAVIRGIDALSLLASHIRTTLSRGVHECVSLLGIFITGRIYPLARRAWSPKSRSFCFTPNEFGFDIQVGDRVEIINHGNQHYNGTVQYIYHNSIVYVDYHSSVGENESYIAQIPFAHIRTIHNKTLLSRVKHAS